MRILCVLVTVVTCMGCSTAALPTMNPPATHVVKAARNALGLASDTQYGDDAREGPMATISVYLENGFENDLVTLGADGAERSEVNVSTRYQIGLASVIEVTLPRNRESTLRVALPNRGLVAETPVDPEVTPYVRVNVRHGSLLVQPEQDPPMFA